MNPLKVKKNDTVFISSTLVDTFFKEIHPHINNEYILISHNSDRNITQEEIKYMDNKILHWFAQNMEGKNNKISVIPIGLENLRYQLNGVLSDFQTTENKEKSKITLLSFNVVTNNKERKKVLEAFKNNRFIEKNSFGNHREYYEDFIFFSPSPTLKHWLNAILFFFFNIQKRTSFRAAQPFMQSSSIIIRI